MIVEEDGAGLKKSSTIKVIGIGQSLRGDDAAGLEAVRLWYETYQIGSNRSIVQMELAELPGIGLLGFLESARIAILVDAVWSGDLPGKIHQVTEKEIASFGSGSGSAHGWGVAETLSLGQALYSNQFPEQIILIGIEAGQLKMGEKLSREVERSLSEVASLIERCVTTALVQR